LREARKALVQASPESAGKLKHILVGDFETYYDKDYSLRRLTPPEYILDPRYETMLLGVQDLTWDGPKILEAHEIAPFLKNYPAEETMFISFNALFDAAIMAWRYHWVPARLQDALGMVRALRNYPRNSLKEVMKQLFGRDTKGDTIHKVIGMRPADVKRAGLWPAYKTYAMGDVRDCMHIWLKLYPEFPLEEQLVMDLVLKAAIDPQLQGDKDMLAQHLFEVRARKAKLLEECGADKAALMSTELFKQSLEALGVEIKTKVSPTGRVVPQFAKSDPFMAELLEYSASYNDDTNTKVQLLAAARLSEKSTIEETRAERFLKISSLQWERAGYLPQMFPIPLRYGGAHTHRLSGEWKMNCQNLPRDIEKSKLRSALIAPPGHTLITADLAQIEARIVACLAGQTNLVEQFAAGEDVYASFASLLFGKPVNKKDNPNERFIGKTAILGLGYGCGDERFYTMVTTDARKYHIPLEGLFDRGTATITVNTYRNLFAQYIAASWRKLDKMLRIMESPSNNLLVWGPVKFTSSKIILPNKMTLRYTLPDERLYGAKLLENITQALARIVVMSAAVRLSQRYWLRFVLQTHDELGFIVQNHEVASAARAIELEMTTPPDWMPNLPLAVEVKAGANYGSCIDVKKYLAGAVNN